MYGFYSPMAAEQYGYAIYSKPDNTLVEVTIVQETPVLDRNFYRWPDTYAVGEITKLVKTNSKVLQGL